MNRSKIAVAALAVLAISCGKPEAPPKPKGITAEAAAAFGRAQVDGTGGSLVVDADALRELGFRLGEGGAQDGDFVLDLAVQLLPTAAAEMKDEPEAAAALARTAVLLRLLAETTKVPELQRLGVVVPVNPVQPEQAAEGALVLLAVKEGAEQNRELLQSLGAAIRAATGRELVRTEQGNLCLAAGVVPDLPLQLCVSSGPGLLALGTPAALATLATPPAASAPREPGAAFRLLARFPGLGRVEVKGEGRGAFRISGLLEPEDPKMVEQVEKGLQAGLAELDAQTERRQAMVAKALGEVKGALEKDAEAPARLKGAAAATTAEKVLDPRGEYAALRKSIAIARAGNGLTVELTVPEAQVRRLARLDQGMGVSTVATVGILSAIAIPNFIKYQCRAKSSEGQLAVRTAWVGMAAARAERGRYPDRLQQLQLEREPGSRYTLCMRSGCLPPASPEAAAACKEALATVAGGARRPAVCAAGFIDGSPDVWLIDESGQPVQHVSACR